ncbi:MAG: hypothetical protein ABR591_00830 [Candidatus Velthaea sp.]
MENYKPGERRRNVLDIIADLGFLERKEQSPQAPVLSLVPPVRPAPADAAASDPHHDVVQALTEAQRQAAEQRMAAEQYLKQTLALEQRLAEEAAQARAASQYARAQQVAAAVEDARSAERKARDYAEACSKRLSRVAAEKAEAEALRTDDRLAVETAYAEVGAAEAALAEARRRLEIANASCTESARRFDDASLAEEAAQRESAAAAHGVVECCAARERLEDELRLAHGDTQRSAPPVPSLASIEDLRALEASVMPPPVRLEDRAAADAAKRVADRRAADAARSAAS